MIELGDFPILNHKTTMKQTSKDDSNKDDIKYMTESSHTVINFDAVAKDYKAKHHLSATPCSNDALFMTRDNVFVFVEFKNGRLGSVKNGRFRDDKEIVCELREKIRDSALLFMDIIEEKVSFARDHIEYILVYNEEKNSCKEIAMHFGKMADTEIIRFGLERFKGYLLKDVHTYTPNQFEEYIKRI